MSKHNKDNSKDNEKIKNQNSGDGNDMQPKEDSTLQDDVVMMEGESMETPEGASQDKYEQKIKELGDELSSLKDKLLRERAEFDNLRKRMVKERSDISINAQFNVISAIIPVLDHFELALASAEQTKKLDALLEGMKLIKAEFEKALSALGVEYINSVGTKFDPSFHEAISSEESEEHGKDMVTRQWRTGYKLGDRVIRPATVVVSTGKPEGK